MSVAPTTDQQPATAAETDPEKLGWMQGFPPAPDRIITFQNGASGVGQACVASSTRRP